MTVTFCGHSQLKINYKIKDKLEKTLIKLIDEGADEFLFSGYGMFDIIAADIVYELKSTYPNIKSIMVAAYVYSGNYSDRYDYTVFPPLEKLPPEFAVTKRNEWMVDKSDTVVSHVDFPACDAALMLEYAKQKWKKIIKMGFDKSKF